MISSKTSNAETIAILHQAPLIGSQSGGLGPAVIGLSQRQIHLGHRASIWCYSSSDEQQGELQSLQYDPQICTFPIVGPLQIGYSPAMERAVQSTVGAEYDVLHQHSIWMARSRVTNRWRNVYKRPTIVAPHGTLEEYAVSRSTYKKWLALRLYEAQNLSYATCLHATSLAEATSIRRFGLRNPIAVIPNGISTDWLAMKGDAERFRDLYRIERSTRILLFVSRVHPKKGLPLLFNALADLRSYLAGWRLVIAGPDEVGHTKELLALAERLRITDLVQVIGPIFGETKRDAFSAADLFVLPTYSENFAIVVTEALAAGVPVLTTHGTPWQEISDHRCGWWVDVKVEAIKEALMDAVHRTSEELIEMGQRGRLLVENKYTWQKAAVQSLELYKWLLKQAEKPDFVILD